MAEQTVRLVEELVPLAWYLLVPDVQAHLRCDQCFGYPSVGPVVVTAGRRTLCGRCAPADGDGDHEDLDGVAGDDGDDDHSDREDLGEDLDDEGEDLNDEGEDLDDEGDDRNVAGGVGATQKGAQGPVVARSLVNVLLEGALFPCSNHYEGCEAVLVFGEAARHEKDCAFGKDQACPFCDYRAGSGSQLVGHCARSHPAGALRPGDVIVLPSPEQRRVLLRADGLRLAAVELEMQGAQRVLVRVRRLAEPQARTQPYRVSFRDDGGRGVFFPVAWTGQERDGSWSDPVEVDLGRHFPGEPMDALCCGVDVGDGDGLDWQVQNVGSLDTCKKKDERMESLQSALDSWKKQEARWITIQKSLSTKDDALKRLETDYRALETTLKATELRMPPRCDADLKQRYFSRGKIVVLCFRCGVTRSTGPMFIDSKDTGICPKCISFAPAEYLDSPYTCPCGEVFPLRRYHLHGSCSKVRRYKCVVSGCDCFLPLEEWLAHWHAEEELRVGDCINLTGVEKQPNTQFYWNFSEEIVFCQFVCDSDIWLSIKKVDVLPTFKRQITLRYFDFNNEIFYNVISDYCYLKYKNGCVISRLQVE